MSNRFLESPLLLSNIIYTDKKPIVGWYLILRNVPGALAEVLQVFTNHSLNIIAMNFSPAMGKEDVLIFIATDFSKTKANVEKIRKELLSQDKVVDAKVIETKLDRVLIDELHFPIIDSEGRRRILMSMENMWLYVVGIRDMLGQAGLSLIYNQGSEVGEKIAASYIARGITDLREALDMTLMWSIALGRFRGEIVKYDVKKGIIIIRLYNNWECEVAKENRIAGPASYMERGILAGLIKSYVMKKVKAEEIKCIANGFPYCEIRIIF
jgi:predicted hydrocarbon binding protein